jgi:hypothetical protein
MSSDREWKPPDPAHAWAPGSGRIRPHIGDSFPRLDSFLRCYLHRVVVRQSRWVPVLLVSLATVAVVAAVTWALRSGGAGREQGDLLISGDAGEDDPAVSGLADIEGASITAQGTDLILTATMAAAIPGELAEGAVDWIWELTSPSGRTWTLAANLNIGLQATLISNQGGRPLSTLDHSFPGRVGLGGDEVTVTLRTRRLRGFPREFEWSLHSSVVIDRSDPAAFQAKDSFPEGEPARFPAP